MSLVLKKFQRIGLYRSLLKQAAQFPTRNRDQLIEDIKLDWKANKDLTGEKQKRAVEHAINGIKHMNQYTQLDKGSMDWKLQL